MEQNSKEKVISIGNTNPSGHGMNGNVFDSEGLAPTITINKGEGPRISEPISYDKHKGKCGKKVHDTDVDNSEDNPKIEKVCNIYPSGGQNGNVYSLHGISPAISSGQGVTGNGIGSNNSPKVVADVLHDSCELSEPAVLRAERTDFGKMKRKSVESGEERISRHDLTELQPRPDGITNTLTGVQKDNLLAEPIPYDDYNGKIPKDTDVIGTITREAGNPAPRHNYKIIEPALHIPEATAKGYAEVPVGGVFDGSYPESDTRRGRVQEGGKVLPTLTCNAENGLRYYEGYEQQSQPRFRIRKLTPRECFRLMGVSDANVDTIQSAGISNCQQYKMAGNSIVVDVLENIFRKLLVECSSPSQQLSLF